VPVPTSAVPVPTSAVPVPTLSDYLRHRFGIVVLLYFGDTGQHSKPHLHVRYQGEESIVEIPSGELLAGPLSGKTLRRVQSWLFLNEEEVMQRWALAVANRPFTKVD
jgi:hypothetical protein